MSNTYTEIPQELYDKFDEFLGLLIELNETRSTLYTPVNQRIAATLDMMVEQKGFLLKDDFTNVLVSLRFAEDGSWKVLDRGIIVQCYHERERGVNRAIDLLTGWCNELIAAKAPEPEVLIIVETPKGKEYKISQEWMGWFQKVLPHYPESAPWEMGALRAIDKHFRKEPTDRIESVFPTNIYHLNQDIEVKFYRVVREKL